MKLKEKYVIIQEMSERWSEWWEGLRQFVCIYEIPQT